MTRRARVILVKEIVDSLRDRRSVATALLYSLLGALVLIPMFAFVGSTLDRGTVRLIRVAMDGAERAPGLVDYLHQHDIEVAPAPADARQAVKDLQYDMVLIVPESYPDDFREGRPATVRIVTDRSRSTVAGEIQRVGQALENYGRTVGALRLVARGVSPSVALAVTIEIDDVAAPESGGASLLAMVPMLLLMSVFVGGMYVAVDVTAGERERGSLEPLLANPVTASDVVLGKLGAVVFFAFSALALSDLAFAVVIGTAPFPDIPGMKFKLDVGGAFQILAALVPLLLPIAALQMLLAGRSRSVKEGNTAVMLLTIVPMLPGMFLAFTPFKPTISSMAAPVFGQEILMNQNPARGAAPGFALSRGGSVFDGARSGAHPGGGAADEAGEGEGVNAGSRKIDDRYHQFASRPHRPCRARHEACDARHDPCRA